MMYSMFVNHFWNTKRDLNEVENEGHAESVHDEGKQEGEGGGGR